MIPAAHAAGSIAGLVVELAGPADDAELRRLLRETPMEGAVRLSLEREPDASLAAAVEGDRHHTFVAREPATGRIVGMGSRAVRLGHVNGECVPLGYLSQLRVDPTFRGRLAVLAAGYEMARALRSRDDAEFDLTSIVADNHAARRLLASARLGLPRYREVERFVTVVLPIRLRGRARRTTLRVERGGPDALEVAAAFLAGHQPRFQFASRFGLEELRSPRRARDLGPADFLLAYEGAHVVGCLAVWDQSGFKQAVIRGYGPPLAKWRPAINAAAALFGYPPLPEPGERLSHAYVSHVAMNPDRREVFAALLDAAVDLARERGTRFLVAGLAARHPLLDPLVRRAGARRFESALCTVDWGGPRREPPYLDGRIAHPEVALL